jgi:FkbM family methyltransferase
LTLSDEQVHMTMHSVAAHELDALLAESVDTVRARRLAAFNHATAGRPLVLYGAGARGRQALAALRSAGIEPVAFADAAAKNGAPDIEGLKVHSPASAAALYGRTSAFVVTVFRPDVHYPTVRAALQAAGCERVVSFVLFAWRHQGPYIPYYALDVPDSIPTMAGEIRAAFDLFSDAASVREYVSAVRWRLLGDYDTVPPPSTNEQYFDDDLFRLRADESFVDCGAYDGDTIRAFLVHASDDFRRIHALEPDPGSFARLKAFSVGLPEAQRARVDSLPYASGAGRATLKFAANGQPSACASENGDVQVEVRALDEILSNERPTYIKMDVEGAEPDSLRGAAEIIRRHRPVLAVCVYHHRDHIWQIPLQVSRLVQDYRYHLRRYGHNFWETVLYAVPKERDSF